MSKRRKKAATRRKAKPPQFAPRPVKLKQTRVRALPKPKTWPKYIADDPGVSRYRSHSSEIYASDPSKNDVADAIRSLKRVGKRQRNGFIRPKGMNAKQDRARKSRVVIVHCIFRSSEGTYMYVPVRVESRKYRTIEQWAQYLSEHGSKIILGSAVGGVTPGLAASTGKNWVLDSIIGITMGAASALPKHRSRTRRTRGNKAGKARR